MVRLKVITNETCGCCHDLLNMLKNYTTMHKDVVYEEDDVKNHKDRKLKGLPFTIVYKNNIEVGSIMGNMDMEIFDLRLNELTK
jgi:hypothetical protein